MGVEGGASKADCPVRDSAGEGWICQEQPQNLHQP